MINFREDYLSWKKAAGHTQQSIADLLDIPRGTIASFECGRSPYPATETLLKMLAAIYPGFESGGKVIGGHQCARCDSVVQGPLQGAAFCSKCGCKFGDACKGCGSVIASGAKFCSGCGKQAS